MVSRGEETSKFQVPTLKLPNPIYVVIVNHVAYLWEKTLTHQLYMCGSESLSALVQLYHATLNKRY